jgi:hypothetical protein
MFKSLFEKKISSLWVLCCAGFLVHSQVRIEPTEGGMKGEPTGYIVYNSGELSDRIPYSRISGSPFWRNEWQLATLYVGTNKVSTLQVRLNFATNEIYFLENGKEYVLANAKVSIIAFHPAGDTSKAAEIFIQNLPDLSAINKNFNGFVQVLNNGDYQLLKYVRRMVSSADSLFRTQKRYFFTDEAFYFLRFKERIERIKRLKKDNILEFLPAASTYESWITQNNIDFKKEADVIRFLDHYNITHPTEKE